MFKYTFGPVTLDSECELPETLPAEPNETAALAIRVVNRIDDDDAEWFHEWRFDTGELWLMLGRLRNGYVLRFPDMADFAITNGARTVNVAAGPTVSLSTMRHLLLDQVVPLALSQQGTLVLHAAAVAGPGGAVALVGAAGHGKSTLTTTLAASGARALTDDTLILTEHEGVVLTHPTYPSVRLWPDAAIAILGEASSQGGRVSQYNDKVRVGARWLEFGTSPVPLRAVYVLSPDDTIAEPVVELLEGQDRLIQLVRHAFVLDWQDANTARMRFEALGRIAARVPVRRLRFRQVFDDLPQIRGMFADDLMHPEVA